ncbi:XRE family transcriptional regulator [Megamonas rupellensis]|nr:XRE family transcriptional regulator [Megamonas rupellensis]
MTKFRSSDKLYIGYEVMNLIKIIGGILMKSLNKKMTFPVNDDLNNSLLEMKQQFFFNKSRSEMIRILLTVGIDAYKKGNRANNAVVVAKSKPKQTKRVEKMSDSFKYAPLIKRYREELSMPIEALAQILDMPEERYRDIENGFTVPTKEEWKDIKDILSIEV